MFKIIEANIKNLIEIENIYQHCELFLKNKKFKHWNNYWNLDKIRQFIKKKEMYILIFNKKIIGVVNIELKEPEYYKLNLNSVYLSGLAILPEYHNNGYAGLLLSYVENYANKNNYDYVLFDVLSKYSKLNKYYNKKGYSKISEINGKKFKYNILFKKIR